MVATPLNNNNSRPARSTASSWVAGEDFYQKLRNTPDIMISIQYNSDELLSFRINTVQHGKIIYSGVTAVGLQCQIGGKTYLLTQEHFEQMSTREYRTLLECLGINSSELRTGYLPKLSFGEDRDSQSVDWEYLPETVLIL